MSNNYSRSAKTRKLSQVCIIHLINHGHVICCFSFKFFSKTSHHCFKFFRKNVFSSTFFLKTFGSCYWPKCRIYALRNRKDTIFDNFRVTPKIANSVVTLQVHPMLIYLHILISAWQWPTRKLIGYFGRSTQLNIVSSS